MKTQSLNGNCCLTICTGCALPDKMLAVVRFARKPGYYNQSNVSCPIAIYIGNEDGVVDDKLNVEVSTSKNGPWTLIGEHTPLADCKGTFFRPLALTFTAPAITGEHWGCNGAAMTLLDEGVAVLDSLCGLRYVRIKTSVAGVNYCRGRIVIYQVNAIGTAGTIGDPFVDNAYEAPAGKVEFIYEFNGLFKQATEDGPYTCFEDSIKYDHLRPDNVVLPVAPEEFEYGWDLQPQVFPKLCVLDTDLIAWKPRLYSATTGVRVTRRRFHPFEENTPAKTGYDPVGFKNITSVWTNKDLPTFIDESKPQWWKSERNLEYNGQTQAAFDKNKRTFANYMKFCEPLDLYCPTEESICRTAQVVGVSYQILLLEGVIKNNFQNIYEDVKTYTEEFYTRQIHHLILRGYLVAKNLTNGDYFSSRFFTTRWYRVCKVTPLDEAPEEIPYEVCRPHLKLPFSNDPSPGMSDGVFLPEPFFPTFSSGTNKSACLLLPYVSKDIPMGIGHIWMVN